MKIKIFKTMDNDTDHKIESSSISNLMCALCCSSLCVKHNWIENENISKSLFVAFLKNKT